MTLTKEELLDTCQLKAIIICNQSDGYLKEWARGKIKEFEGMKLEGINGICQCRRKSRTRIEKPIKNHQTNSAITS